MPRTVLLTGVTGFLGKVVLEELLRRDELAVTRVDVLIRPKGRRDAEARFAREIAGSPCFRHLPRDWQRRVRVIPAKLDGDQVELDAAVREQITAETTHIMHAAASVDFGLPITAAARANITTSLNVLELARACRALERLVAVSTAYVTPHQSDRTPIPERPAPLPRPAADLYHEILAGRADEGALLGATGHPNTYTLTKAIAEHLLLDRCGAVPLAIVRPSIISASRERPFPGWIDSGTGFAAFVALIGAGHMRAVIGRPRARLDLVPVDHVADRMIAACDGPPPAPDVRIHHVVAGLEHSASVRACWEGIRDFFSAQPVDRRPAIRYLGPAGARFRLAHAWHHRLRVALAALWSERARRVAGQMLARVRQLNRAFPYFTQRSFAFEQRAGPPADFEPHAYVATVCRGVSRHLLGRDDGEWLLAGRRHAGHGSDLRWALRRRRGSPVIRFAAWAMTKVLRRCVDRVTVDVPSFEAARRAAPAGATFVVVPSHRSYLDFVLCSYLFFARPDLGIPVPHVAAATEFARIPLVGRVLHALNAFYVARGPRRENKDLARRVRALITKGKTIEFFIEGTRSRSREFLPPKRGLLRCVHETGRTCAILPVAISYDRVPEEAAFARELAGGAKPTMRLRGLLDWARRAWRGEINLGHVHLRCGPPVRLDTGSDVQVVSQEIMARLQQATVATTFHLRSFLERHPIAGADVAWLKGAIEARGGRVLRSDLAPPPDLDPLIAGTLRHQFAHLFRDDTTSDTRVHRLRYALFGPAALGAGDAIAGTESVA